MKYQIKQACYNDVKKMMGLAANEGWAPGLQDARAFLSIDPNGFFSGYMGDELVSCISNVKYSDSFSFLGLYIGYKIWQYAMNYAKGSNIGLDGVVAQQDNYKKSDFRFAHRNIRYCLAENTIRDYSNKSLIPVQSLPIQYILNYNKKFFACPRNVFLINWLLMNNAISLVYYDTCIKGYGVIRKCQVGYKVGPLFADNIHVANAIFKGLCSLAVQNELIYLDIPEPNKCAKLFVKKFAMNPVFETARMYTGAIPKISIDRTFGITSFEVG